MSSRALTVRSLETIKPGLKQQETLLPSLYLVIQPSGARSWAVRYRSGGRTRKQALDTDRKLDVKAARALAREALRGVAEGRDPGHEKAQARA